MVKYKGYQKQYLRGIAHGLKPVVYIGQNGLTDEVLRSANQALDSHELIKVKFNEFKEKDQKKELSLRLESATKSEVVGMIGHTAIFFRQQESPEKRKIKLPQRNEIDNKSDTFGKNE